MSHDEHPALPEPVVDDMVTAEQQVAALHPYFKWSPQHTRQAAAQIAELVRYLNHATQQPSSMGGSPNTVADTLLELSMALQRLPQTLHQLAHRLNVIAADPRLRLSGAAPTDAGAAVLTAVDLMYTVAQVLGVAADDLAKAGHRTARMYLSEPPDPPEAEAGGPISLPRLALADPPPWPTRPPEPDTTA